ncbi:hypothetical protein OSC13_18850 [Serratia marcescens]|uniref:hypothetical protein n=1 Tax=Serratia marcescens TaxID=615 RepID=UPI00112D5B2A|nr:hypothetical protein [Serratia marcescens]MDS0779973.1 hypothetical protein [Serratia marcescens]TPV69949.1 hypothetical protein FJ699_05450 [Serratia marcescens]
MTLTTEQLKARITHYRELAYRYGMSGNQKHEAQYRDDAAFLEELLANREAQPAGFYTTVSGRKGVIWHNGAPEDDTAIYTAPPAPAVPEEMTIEQSYENVQTWHYANGWNACRAAMLAQPVSQRYTLPPHVFRELVNSLRDTAVKYQGTQQLREQLSRTLTDKGLSAAAQEGGNDHDAGR